MVRILLNVQYKISYSVVFSYLPLLAAFVSQLQGSPEKERSHHQLPSISLAITPLFVQTFVSIFTPFSPSLPFTQFPGYCTSYVQVIKTPILGIEHSSSLGFPIIVCYIIFAASIIADCAYCSAICICLQNFLIH